MITALALALMLVGSTEGTCSESLRAVAAVPRDVFGESRLAAVEGAALGTPRRVSVEVSESRHDFGDGEFLPLVHYRLKYRHLELQYVQSAVGGRELLEEVALLGPEPRLKLPFRMSATLPEVRTVVGDPIDAGEFFLHYSCSNLIGADEVQFQFSKHDGRLIEVVWVYFVD